MQTDITIYSVNVAIISIRTCICTYIKYFSYMNNFKKLEDDRAICSWMYAFVCILYVYKTIYKNIIIILNTLK